MSKCLQAKKQILDLWPIRNDDAMPILSHKKMQRSVPLKPVDGAVPSNSPTEILKSTVEVSLGPISAHGISVGIYYPLKAMVQKAVASLTHFKLNLSIPTQKTI